jgi:hypothetical protein
MPEEPSAEEEWPPPDARRRGAIWRAEGHLEREEYAAAAHALEGFSDDRARGLRHLAAAGYRAQAGDVVRARRQLVRAHRLLGDHALLAGVERVIESAGGELAQP